jgi:hypothetical protein
MEHIMNRTSSTFTQSLDTFFTPSSKGTGALFNFAPKDGDEVKVTEFDNGDTSQLVVSGALRLDDAGYGDLPIQIAGFQRNSKDFLDLVIQTKAPVDRETGEIDTDAERVKYTGKLWNERKKEGGKRSAIAPDYTGYITVLPVTQKGQYSGEQWDEAPRLQVVGYLRRNANSTARVELRFHAQHVSDHEMAF